MLWSHSCLQCIITIWFKQNQMRCLGTLWSECVRTWPYVYEVESWACFNGNIAPGTVVGRHHHTTALELKECCNRLFNQGYVSRIWQACASGDALLCHVLWHCWVITSLIFLAITIADSDVVVHVALLGLIWYAFLLPYTVTHGRHITYLCRCIVQQRCTSTVGMLFELLLSSDFTVLFLFMLHL